MMSNEKIHMLDSIADQLAGAISDIEDWDSDDDDPVLVELAWEMRDTRDAVYKHIKTLQAQGE